MSAACLQAVQFKTTAQAEMSVIPQQVDGQQCIIDSMPLNQVGSNDGCEQLPLRLTPKKLKITLLIDLTK